MKEETSSESEEEDDGGEHQRKSKKRALKKFNHHRQRELPLYDTFVTIAEGRSRRMLKKVDYNFHSYDEQLQVLQQCEAVYGTSCHLQEAMDDESSAKPASPVSGLGRGKDMQNIIEAENKRKASADNTENTPPAARPPSKKQKKHKRLTDLDIDNATESDTTSYKATRFWTTRRSSQSRCFSVPLKWKNLNHPTTSTCLRVPAAVGVVPHHGVSARVTRNSLTMALRVTTHPRERRARAVGNAAGRKEPAEGVVVLEDEAQKAASAAGEGQSS